MTKDKIVRLQTERMVVAGNYYVHRQQTVQSLTFVDKSIQLQSGPLLGVQRRTDTMLSAFQEGD